MRNWIELNHGWRFAGQADTLEQALASPAEPVTLPHTWNAEDGANGKPYLRAKCWYLRPMECPALAHGEEYWLEFQGAAVIAEVWLNGEKLARHEGGYTAFRVNLTPALAEQNLLAVSVDNRKSDAVYPQDADFTFYGGLYRAVRAITVPAAHFALGYYGAPGIRVTPEVKGTNAEVIVEAWTEGPAKEVRFTVDAQSQTAPVKDGHAAAKFTIPNARLWAGRRDPYLYIAHAELDSGDALSARFGCRTIRFDPEEGFFLNGRSCPLRGVARHQDREGVGSAITEEMQREDMALMAEMGVNTIRLAHYPHSQFFYDLCDEYGMAVWAEIPYISRHLARGRQNTLDQIRELVLQCRNHPSIICWGLSNEITMLSEIDEDLLENHRQLNDLCHALDSTRPTTMVHVFSCPMDSPIQEVSDLRSYNIYFGWYQGTFEENGQFLDRFHALHPDLCLGLSEYGADANPKLQSPEPERGDYTESYQALYHEHLLETIEARPWLWATHVWNMFDFGVAARNEGGNPGRNQKGLVTMDRKTRKDAYYLYKAHWSAEPFVHLCGRRYVDRTEDVTEIKVYSNQSQVELYVNGKLFASQTGKHIFRFRVPMDGEMDISAQAGGCGDVIHLRKVAEPNKSYTLENSGGVVNWFDQDSFKENFCSVKDSTRSLVDNPLTHDRAVEFCEKMSPGFVFDKQMMKAFGGLPLEGMIRRNLANLTEDEIRAFNEFLQRTPKKEAAT